MPQLSIATLAIYGLTVKVQLRAACGIHTGNQHINGLTVKVQLCAACGKHAGNQHIKWTDGEGAATCHVRHTRWQPDQGGTLLPTNVIQILSEGSPQSDEPS